MAQAEVNMLRNSAACADLRARVAVKRSEWSLSVLVPIGGKDRLIVRYEGTEVWLPVSCRACIMYS
jgi:hypothetical protein